MKMKLKCIAAVIALMMVLLSGCATQGPPAAGGEAGVQADAMAGQGLTGQPAARQPAAASAPVRVEYSGVNENAALYESLAEAGLGNALVDFQRDKILVALELPEGYNEESTAYYAIGLAAAIAEPSQEISVEIIKQAGNSKYSVSASKARQFADGTIAAQQFEAAVKKS